MAYDDTLFQLGMDLTRSSPAQKEDLSDKTAHIAHNTDEAHSQDFICKRDGVRFAGTHLSIDMYGARRLDDLKHIERTIKRCVEVAGATLLHVHLHRFTSDGGVSAVAVLDKGHVNIRTWSDRRFAVVDMLYMSRNGELRQHLVDELEASFQPAEVVVKVSKRAEDSSRAEVRLAPVAKPEAPVEIKRPRVARPSRVARAA